MTDKKIFPFHCEILPVKTLPKIRVKPHYTGPMALLEAMEKVCESYIPMVADSKQIRRLESDLCDLIVSAKIQGLIPSDKDFGISPISISYCPIHRRLDFAFNESLSALLHTAYAERYAYKAAHKEETEAATEHFRQELESELF